MSLEKNISCVEKNNSQEEGEDNEEDKRQEPEGTSNMNIKITFPSSPFQASSTLVLMTVLINICPLCEYNCRPEYTKKYIPCQSSFMKFTPFRLQSQKKSKS